MISLRYNPEVEGSIPRLLGEELIAAAKEVIWAQRTGNRVALRRAVKRLKELVGE